MTSTSKLITAWLVALNLTASHALAADLAQARGRHFMTEQERAQMRTRMQNATTEEMSIRAEEHALVRERAAAQGNTLLETPPAPETGLVPPVAWGKSR